MKTPFIAIANRGTTKAGFIRLDKPTFVLIEGETDKSFYGLDFFDRGSYHYRFRKNDVISLKSEDLIQFDKYRQTNQINWHISEFIFDYVKIWQD